MTDTFVDLSRFSAGNFDRGRCACVEVLWRVVSALVFQCPLVPFYGLKRTLLRRFGAKIGTGVIIKPRVTITFPWRLEIGDHSWIGEDVWLDSLAQVTIGHDVCISQGAYLCTGNHDYRSKTFDLVAKPIVVGAGGWIAAKAVVGPGVIVGTGAVLSLGSVATADLEEFGIYRGNPAEKIGHRTPTK
jgi:putative colanic acid biosynthesis acetyltransferase WcaF